jgi:hypothetical protein
MIIDLKRILNSDLTYPFYKWRVSPAYGEFPSVVTFEDKDNGRTFMALYEQKVELSDHRRHSAAKVKLTNGQILILHVQVTRGITEEDLT